MLPLAQWVNVLTNKFDVAGNSTVSRWHGTSFLIYNGLAVAREVAILAPLTALVWWWRSVRRT